MGGPGGGGPRYPRRPETRPGGIAAVHIFDADDRGERWRIIMEVSRELPTFEALVPKEASALELDAFIERLATTLRRVRGNGGG
jgi:hypothetical protein